MTIPDLKYSTLIAEIGNLEQAAKNKGLAKLGDEIINMCYSIAISLFEGRCTGIKISAKVLSEAMKQSGLRYLARKRAKAHDIADSAEAIIAYAFLNEKVTIKEITSKILNGLEKSKKETTTVNEKRNLKIEALNNLLIHLKEKLSEKKSKKSN
ncbi:MAG: ribonuclease III family protein [Promethearchaeota archaeon]